MLEPIIALSDNIFRHPIGSKPCQPKEESRNFRVDKTLRCLGIVILCIRENTEKQ